MEIIVSETGASGGSGSLIEALTSVVNELWSGEIRFRERGGPRAPHLLPGFRNGESPSPNGNGNGGPNLEAGPGIAISGDEIAAHISTQMPNALHVGTDEGLRVTPAGVPDPLLISDGTDAAPSLAFASEPTLGITRAGPGELLVTGELTAAGIVSINHVGNAALAAEGDNNCNIILSAVTGQSILLLRQNGLDRWQIAKVGPPGGNLQIRRYNDAGVFQGAPLSINRTNGLIVLESGLILGISADADNALVQGSDNMLFVPTPADPTLTAGNGIAVAGLTISAALSADANNAAVFGSDNGIFVPDPAAPTAGNGIAIAGGVISAALSADANNALVFGSDNGLFVPDPAAPDPTTFISTDANNTLVAGTDSLLFVPAPTPPTAASFISADAGNQIVQGTDNLLLVPATPPQIAGSVATVGDLPATGEVGQYYIVEADGNLYGWTAP